jgi:hypothetical protein
VLSDEGFQLQRAWGLSTGRVSEEPPGQGAFHAISLGAFILFLQADHRFPAVAPV